MTSIVVASEYTSVHSKAWLVPKKKPRLEHERILKGHCKLGAREFDSGDDLVKAMRQDTDQTHEKFRYPGQRQMTNIEKRYTNGMWSNELAKRILKANPNLFVEDSKNIPGCAGFYKMVEKKKVAAGKPNASFRHGYMPEATIVTENHQHLATEFIYGWRQVLIRLRRSGDLTALAFKRLWGVVDYSDERAKGWANDLSEFKV